jgi:hypothetical protein
MSREINNGKQEILSRDEVFRSVEIASNNDNLDILADWIMGLQEEITKLNNALDRQISSQTGWPLDDQRVQERKEEIIKG